MKLQGLNGRLEHNFPLKKLSTWRIGGLAETVFWPQNEEDLVKVWLEAKGEGIPIRFFGRGSNILFPNEFLPGITIITTQLNQTHWDEQQVKVGAGISLAALAREAAQRGLTGLEFGAGIPGTVGGAIVMNAGAHGGSIEDVLAKVKIMTMAGEIKVLEKEDLEFGYRKCSLRDQALILEGVFQLGKGDRESIKQTMSEYLSKRKASQPLEYPNAGSVFRNPPGDSAGRLIEKAGWKGKKYGDAQVSEKHANFIVNLGNATACQVRSLIEDIQKDVQEKYGVELKPEVCIVKPE
ncbi:MAG: UDP-N-acetylmuramate dehydrogenase [Desulfitobacterium sp.]|nr:UDP-N-acetylmuramate dehydrogenase [Desulfitobacterium sp.]